MAKNTKKDDTAVDTAAENTETAPPTKSLFGMAPKAEEDSTDVPETAVEVATELPAEAEATADAGTTEATAEAPTASTSNLDDLSVEELSRQQAEITRRLDEKRNSEKKGILDQVVLVIAEYGITTEEVVNALGGYKPKRIGTPAKIKFRDTATGNEWSGRGKEPLWIKGKDRAQFAVAEEAPAA